MTEAAPFLVSARKYRPQTFSDLVAQDHVAETLRNAIRSDRLAHAYLFCGPRGVGKTTAARILAKAVNCERPVNERPDLEPCRACTSCLDFEAGRSLNMIEIDAASHNGVDYMRDLRDSIRIPPQGARKKVYVLDEVHMLSSGAFNALLKTLEEPPPHALFIFATTEPHKVLPTILSRTQRFDFRRISVPDIIAQLRSIADDEGFTADEDSLVLLARKADGAMRDALSLFDQAVALCGTSLEGSALRNALGVVGTDEFFAASDLIVASDRAGLIHTVDHIVRTGHDLREYVLGLADHLRNLLVAASTGSAELIEGTTADRARYLDRATHISEITLLHCLMIADGAVNDLKDGPHPRLSLELALLKMASLATSANLAQLVRQAEKPKSFAPAAIPAATRNVRDKRSSPAIMLPSRPSAASVNEPPPPPYGSELASTLATDIVEETPPSSNALDDSTDYEALHADDVYDVDASDGDGGDEGVLVATAPVNPGAVASDVAAAAPLAGHGLFGPPALTRLGAPQTDSDDAAAAIAYSEAHAGGDGASADVHFGASLARLKSSWASLANACQMDAGVRLGAVLRQGAPARIHRGHIEIGLADLFACTLADQHADVIRNHARSHIDGEMLPLRFVVSQVESGGEQKASDPFEVLKQLRQDHPVVRALFDRFGAEIVWS